MAKRDLTCRSTVLPPRRARGGAWMATAATVLVACGTLNAQSSAPATAPATTPAATQPVPDASTPKGAVRLFFFANATSDAATIRSMMFASSPLEEKLADTVANLSAANNALQKAVRDTFGADQGRAELGDPMASARTVDQALEKLPEQMDGDRAVVPLDRIGNFRPMELRKDKGVWKVVISKALEKANPADVEKQLAAAGVQVKVIRDVTTDVTGRKFKNVADVKQTLDARVRQALMQYVQEQSKAATSQPATTTTQGK